MLIVCPNCATSYQVEAASLGAAGRSVRCVRCKKIWFASNPEAMAAIAAGYHQDVAAFSTADAGTAPPQAQAASAQADPPPPEAGLDRDDRGPASLPEAVDYQLPTQPPPIDDAPPLAPDSQPDSQPDTPPEGESIPEDIESVAARRLRRPPKRPKRQFPGWATAVLLLLTLNIGLVAWRADIVRMLPQTAWIYAAIGLEVNLRGLVFTDLVTRKESHDGVQMLLVEGVIKNPLKRPTDVPRIRFAVRDTKGHEVYTWTAVPAQNVLAPGATMPFRSRLASPPPDSQAVLVRFFTRRDLVAGAQ